MVKPSDDHLDYQMIRVDQIIQHYLEAL
ncbi:uncharacterized protein METZ01_LOCUS297521 [marine metagenome]|uniref:Uncharacterized protein n=1 Tax=marine metagenome TaxID=408172 RepID=A0A382MAF1_9ZZZZ